MGRLRDKTLAGDTLHCHGGFYAAIWQTYARELIPGHAEECYAGQGMILPSCNLMTRSERSMTLGS